MQQPSHLAPSVTPRPVKAAGANGLHGKPLGSLSSRAGRTYTPSVSPVKTTPRFSLGEASKANELLRPPEATVALSPISGGRLQLRKKPIILTGDVRNLESNFALAMSRVQVSRAHVTATLARYGVAVSSDEAQTLLFEYEETNDAGLSYDAFVDDLVQVVRHSKAGTSRTLGKKVQLPCHLEKLATMHAHVTRELQTLLGGKLRVSWTVVRDTFRSADTDRRGQLPTRVFAALCRQLQLPLPDTVLNGLVLRSDPRTDGVVDYNDFLATFGVDFHHSDPNSVSTSLEFERAIVAGKGAVYGIDGSAVNDTLSSPGVSSGSKKKRADGSSAAAASEQQQPDLLALEQLRIALNEKLSTRYSDVKTAFQALDKDNSGRLSATEFARVLESFNLVVSRSEFDALLVQLDATYDNVVDYTEFLARFGEVLKPTVGTLTKQLQENSSLVFTGHHRDVKGGAVANKCRLALSSPGNELKEAFSRLSDAIWRAMYVELEMSDPRKTGLVPSAELLRVLAKYLGELPSRHFAVLFRACGSHVNQFMNYRTLVKSYRPSALDAVEFYQQDRHALAAKAYSKSPTESLVVVWSVRMQRAQLTPAEWLAFKETIWKADARRQGRILAAEFQPILRRFLRLSDDQVAFLCFFYEDKNLSSDHVLIRYSSFLTDYEDPGLEDAETKQQPRSSARGPRTEGKGRPRPPYQATRSSPTHESGPTAFTDADRMEREQDEKRVRDFFAANVRPLEALVSREDPEKRGFVTLDTFVRLCKELNGGLWKDSAATSALFSKYTTQNQLLYYRGFLLDFDQKVGLQTQALVLQDDDDDNDGGDRYDGDEPIEGTLGLHHAKTALRHQLTSSMRRQQTAYKVFQRMDPGKSGILGYAELRRALERLEIVIDDATARELFTRFEDDDDDGNKVVGRVKYLQFLHAYGGRDPDKALDGMSELSSNCSYYSAITISPRPAVRSHRPQLTTRDAVAAATAVSNAIEKPWNGGGGGSSTISTGAAAAAAVERKIKGQLEAQGKTKWKQLARAFQQLDSDRRGSVAASSFRKVFEAFGVLLDAEELARLQLKYDVEQNGRLHYHEYLRHLTNAMSDRSVGAPVDAELLPSLAGTTATSPRKPTAAHSATVDGISEGLRQGVRAQWKAIYSSFKTLDKANVGRVSAVHFRQLLEWYALPVSDEAFLSLLRQFDHAEDGGVDYNKFMRSCFSG